jgi:hypothetical protein
MSVRSVMHIVARRENATCCYAESDAGSSLE